MARPWRLATGVVTLRTAVNAKWPTRDRRSDGTIGDAAHASRSSDHNPWVVVDDKGVVRAWDADVDGINAAWYAEELRKLGAAGDPRLTGGGYVIFNRRITTPDFKGWKVYTGTNPHTSHVHVSFSRNRAGFDSAAPWPFLLPPPPPPPPPPAPRKELVDMTLRIVRGNSPVMVPGKPYPYGGIHFWVELDPRLPNDAQRWYAADTPAFRGALTAQGGADWWDQKDLDAIPIAEGGEIPPSVFG